MTKASRWVATRPMGDVGRATAPNTQGSAWCRCYPTAVRAQPNSASIRLLGGADLLGQRFYRPGFIRRPVPRLRRGEALAQPLVSGRGRLRFTTSLTRRRNLSRSRSLTRHIRAEVPDRPRERRRRVSATQCRSSSRGGLAVQACSSPTAYETTRDKPVGLELLIHRGEDTRRRGEQQTHAPLVAIRRGGGGCGRCSRADGSVRHTGLVCGARQAARCSASLRPLSARAARNHI